MNDIECRACLRSWIYRKLAQAVVALIVVTALVAWLTAD